MISLLSLTFILVLAVYFKYDHVLAQRKQESCAEVVADGINIKGVYKFEVRGLKYDAYCIPDPVHGPAWTIIQRRMDGSVNFTRNWADYENGFGNVSGEYWLGLKQIHALTNSQGYDLWIEVGDWNEEYSYARYSYFNIANASEQYTLSIAGYFGLAGDSLSYSNDCPFVTIDRDINDCVATYKGGWWMNSCYESNLNGEYKNQTKFMQSGVKWESFLGLDGALKYAHMAIRPVNYTNYPQ